LCSVKTIRSETNDCPMRVAFKWPFIATFVNPFAIEETIFKSEFEDDDWIPHLWQCFCTWIDQLIIKQIVLCCQMLG
jgi:hypothetical protein